MLAVTKIKFPKSILIVALFFCSNLVVHSQKSTITYSFLNYSINEGLPSSEIYDIYQDTFTGFLWIGTDRGLVKYDGYTFSVYTLDDGLTDNVILRLTPDNYGNLWLHSLNGQPCYLAKNGKILPFKFNEELKEKYSASSATDLKIISLHFDENKNLHLTPQHFFGKIIIDSTGEVSLHNFLSDRYSKGYINFFPDQNYHYLSTTPECYYSYPISDKAFGTIHQINDSAFVLTDNSEIRIYSGSLLKNKIETSKQIMHSGRFNDTVFWVSYLTGGVDFFELNGKLNHHFLTNEIVSHVMTDHEGGTWFTTLSNGIFYLKNTRVKTLSINSDIRLSSISSSGNTLFLGYYNGDIFELNTTTFDYLYHDEYKIQAPVMVQCDTSNKGFYFASRLLSGWSKSDLGTSKIFSYGTTKISDDQNINGVFFSSYSSFLERSKDTISINNIAIKVKDVSQLDGNLIIATNEGLYKYVNQELVKIEGEELNFRIEDVDKFRGGIICASLGGGCIRYNENKPFAIKKENGLLNNLCSEVFVQNDSTVWVATTSGVNKIIFDSNENYTISSYTVADGLISNEIVDIDMTGDQIWIATKKGLNLIDKNDEIPREKLNLYLTITDVTANGVEKKFTDNKLQLNYDDNNVQVFFNAISFSRNQSLIYRYRLVNAETNWLITKNRSVVFPALSLGLHELEIQASTDNVNWSEKVTLTISIAPPFWKTWWFIISMVILILLILLFIFIYILKQQKLKTIAIEMEMKALRAQMNPHFIFNALASIQNFILKGNTNDSNKYLTKFSKLIRGVLENSKTELVTIQKELNLLNLYVELEQLRVKPFEYQVIIDPKIDSTTSQIPPLILQPFIENAIWHGIEPSEKKNILRIELKQSENKLVCTIDDNGVGRNYIKAKKEDIMKIKGKSFGIEITKERIANLKKTQDLDVSFLIIDKVDENSASTGTRIEIILPLINLK